MLANGKVVGPAKAVSPPTAATEEAVDDVHNRLIALVRDVDMLTRVVFERRSASDPHLFAHGFVREHDTKPILELGALAFRHLMQEGGTASGVARLSRSSRECHRLFR